MSVFKVSQDYKTVINPDAAKLVPELKLLDQDELIFCILVADDVDGPLRKKPVSERLLMAKRRYPDVDEESEKIKMAIDGYKSLVFDRRKYTIEVLNRRYRDIDLEIETDHSMSANKLAERLKMQDLLNKRIDAIQSDIDSDEQAYELMGGKKLSYIEQWQLNQKEYQEFKNEL